MKRDLIRIFGRVVVNMRTLPAVCQNGWPGLLTLPLQTKVVRAAHRQIKQTKETLGLDEAKGLLLLANEGNADFEAHNLLLTVAHILKKKHPDGSPQYSSIRAASIFSHNLLVSSPDLPGHAFFWMNGHRPFCDDSMKAFQSKLEQHGTNRCPSGLAGWLSDSMLQRESGKNGRSEILVNGERQKLSRIPAWLQRVLSAWKDGERGRNRIHLKTSIEGLTEHGRHSKDLEVPGSSR